MDGGRKFLNVRFAITTNRIHLPSVASSVIFHRDARKSHVVNNNERIDPFTGTRVHIVAARQHRPNSPTESCPFCVGGLEAPTEYMVKSIPNRWPALERGVCEVVLYSSKHDASLASLELAGIRSVIDTWAERTDALLQQDQIEYVLVFENRGAEVGATIQHPHGQIYAFDHVPARQHQLLSAPWTPDTDAGLREVVSTRDFISYTQHASIYPVSLVIAPRERVGSIQELSDAQRTEFATMLRQIFTALDQLYSAPLPYMMWITQSPRSKNYKNPWLHMEIVSPMRAPGVQRYIAAAEVSTNEYFNPVDPTDIAQRLRDLMK